MVIDEAQELTKFLGEDENGIQTFLKGLFVLSEGNRFKLVFAGSEMLFLWHTIATTAPNGFFMPNHALQLRLPEVHPPALLAAIDDLLVAKGMKPVPLFDKSNPYAPFLTTAAQKVAVSSISRLTGKDLLGSFEEFQRKIVDEYNGSLAGFLRYLYAHNLAVFEEILQLAQSSKLVKCLDDLSIYHSYPL
jgi:hypothetical protein